MKQLRIRIYQDGYVHVETTGIKGKSCQEYIPFMKRILQNRVQEQEYTHDFYEESQEIILTEMESIRR